MEYLLFLLRLENWLFWAMIGMVALAATCYIASLVVLAKTKTRPQVKATRLIYAAMAFSLTFLITFPAQTFGIDALKRRTVGPEVAVDVYSSLTSTNKTHAELFTALKANGFIENYRQLDRFFFIITNEPESVQQLCDILDIQPASSEPVQKEAADSVGV